MSECKWCVDGICVNADSPDCADYCPLPSMDAYVGEGVCRYEEVQDELQDQ